MKCILLFGLLFGFCVAQDFKKEFEKRWKSGNFEEQANAIFEVAGENNLDAAKLIIKGLEDVAKIQTNYQSQIEAIEKQTAGLDDNDQKKVSAQLEIIQLINKLGECDVIIERAGKGMASFTDGKAIEYLANNALKGKNLDVKISTINAVGKLDSPEAVEILIKALKDKTPQIRQIAATALQNKTPLQAFDPLIKLLNDDAWQVRSVAAETLGKYGDSRAIEPLIARLEKERGRVAQDFEAALKLLTGESHEGNVTVWKARLNSEREKWMKGTPKIEEGSSTQRGFDIALRGTIHYYNSGGSSIRPIKSKDPNAKQDNVSVVLTPDSERMIYLLDISGSMNEKAPETLVKAEGTAVIGEKAPSTTKIDVLKKRLISELPKLLPYQQFTIILFGSDVFWWQKELVPATPANIKKAQEYIQQIEARGMTNTFGALEEAFNMAGRGSVDKNYASGVDTIILISDGLPSTGKYFIRFNKNDKGQLQQQTVVAFLDAVQKLNKIRRIQINCIGIPADPMDDLLGGIAAENGGVYYYWQLK